MEDKKDPADNRRTHPITIYVTNLEYLRLEVLRQKMSPLPTRSSLLHAIVREWINNQETKKK